MHLLNKNLLSEKSDQAPLMHANDEVVNTLHLLWWSERPQEAHPEHRRSNKSTENVTSIVNQEVVPWRDKKK